MKTIGWLLATTATLGILSAASAESAEVQPSPAARLAPDTIFIKTGLAEETATFSLGAGWNQNDWLWPPLRDTLSLTFDLEIGHWQTFHPGHGQTEFTQFGITPMLRYPLAANDHVTWFAEGGVGCHFIVPLYRKQEEHFSTSFNFQDLIGIGLRFGAARQHELVLYISHFSNGDINRPNPGENFLQMRYLRHFD